MIAARRQPPHHRHRHRAAHAGARGRADQAEVRLRAGRPWWTRTRPSRCPAWAAAQPRVLGRQILCEIIEPRVEEIFQLVHREIQKCGYEDLLACGVVITGGSTLLAGHARAGRGGPRAAGAPRHAAGHRRPGRRGEEPHVRDRRRPGASTAPGTPGPARCSGSARTNVYRKVKRPDARVAGGDLLERRRLATGVSPKTCRGRRRADDGRIRPRRPCRTRCNGQFDQSKQAAKIQVVGVGGGGCNAVNTMIAAGLEGVDFIAANTDIQALAANNGADQDPARRGADQGPGRRRQPGGRPRGRAGDRKDEIAEALEGADMVFVTAGMGGGTGTGAAPVIADIASSWAPHRRRGDQAVRLRGQQAPQAGRAGHRRAQGRGRHADHHPQPAAARRWRPSRMPLLDAFKRADEVLLNAVQGIRDLIQYHGYINVDFADVRTIMSDMGRALMGTGRAHGREARAHARRSRRSPARCSRTSASTAPPACSSTSPAAAT